MRSGQSLKRKVNVRLPKRKFIIYTEGKNTEPDYFRAVKKSLSGTLVDIEIIGAAGVPTTIAKNASATARSRSRRGRTLSSFEENDEIWAVFDCDEHPFIADALAKCDGAGVGTAFSNPCFELWLILHYTDFDRADDRHQIQKACRVYCSGYDPARSKTTDCDALMPFVVDAENRAQRQLERRRKEGIPEGPPFTTVFMLTRKIREAHEIFQNSIRV